MNLARHISTVFVLRVIYEDLNRLKRAALLCNGKRCKDIVY
jgi:hypothetical protein